MINCKYCILTKEKMKELNRKNWTCVCGAKV